MYECTGIRASNYFVSDKWKKLKFLFALILCKIDPTIKSLISTFHKYKIEIFTLSILRKFEILIVIMGRDPVECAHYTKCNCTILN